jgi:hypothetical protein
MTGGRRVGALVSALAIGAVAGLATPSEARPTPERTTESPAALPGAVARETGCDDAIVPAASVEAKTKRLVGEIVSVDSRDGRIVLATRTGNVSLSVSPETASDLDIGDVLVVEVVPEADSVISNCR